VVFGHFPAVEGLENIPQDKKVILVSNHPSFLDPFLLNAALPGFYNFIIFATILDNPYAGLTIRCLGLVVRRYGHFLSGSNTIIRTVKAIKEGDSFILFPSERVVPDGGIEEIRHGLYKIIEDTEAVILPVFITDKLMFTFLQRPFRPKVVIGKPLDKRAILYGKDTAIRQAVASLGQRELKETHLS
jgi:1-acyl-sn-glycerol-3-phosphate acyltransferase